MAAADSFNNDTPPNRGKGLISELLSGKENPDGIHWTQATVIENTSASADGSIRTLELSVEDPVNLADGRRVKRVKEAPRWVDAYHVPGQFVAVRYCSNASDATSSTGSLDDCSTPRVAQRLFALASSPYDAKRASALLDASIVELLVSRMGTEDERQLADLRPGALVEVSQVMGSGYISLFNAHVSLQSALEEGRSLLMIGWGARGIAPLRAALSWTPVQAHATAHKTALLYVAESPAAAAYLVDWDGWREAGASVHPLYLSNSISNAGNAPSDLAGLEAAFAAASAGEEGAASGPTPESSSAGSVEAPSTSLAANHEKARALLLHEIFHAGEHGVRSLLGDRVGDAVVLISGVPGDVAAELTRKLTQAGISSERVLFCDFF